DGHDGKPVDAGDEEEDEGEDVDEGCQERLAAFGEEQDREEKKHVVVEVEVGSEKERGGDGGAEGDGCASGLAADLAHEVDGGGEDEDGEEDVEREGEARGKKARAADVEQAVESGHGLGVDGDGGLGVVA